MAGRECLLEQGDGREDLAVPCVFLRVSALGMHHWVFLYAENKKSEKDRRYVSQCMKFVIIISM